MGSCLPFLVGEHLLQKRVHALNGDFLFDFENGKNCTPVHFRRLFVFTLSAAFFVVRTKSNVLLQRRYSHAVDKSTGVRSDQTVILTSFESASA
jgi:hypothetical protein